MAPDGPLVGAIVCPYIDGCDSGTKGSQDPILWCLADTLGLGKGGSLVSPHIPVDADCEAASPRLRGGRDPHSRPGRTVSARCPRILEQWLKPVRPAEVLAPTNLDSGGAVNTVLAGRLRLGWSVQRPTGVARERDERAVRTWKAKRWPELKKSLRDRAG